MKRLPIIVLLLGVAAFAFGLAHLYRLRFEAGDVYPPYSSLRADPLGAKALFESLDHLLSARRNFRPLVKLNDGPDTTLLILGAVPAGLYSTVQEFEKLESFAGQGGRIVISLQGIPLPPRPNRFQKAPPPRRQGQRDDEEKEDERPVVHLTNRWKVCFEYVALERERDDESYRPALAQRQSADPLPATFPCHTTLCFTDVTNQWRAIYARTNEKPVLIERRFGRGSIVLCADSYPFSNEALLKERQTPLLTWMVGPSRQVVFDETHLGVEEDAGVATLARRYRLHGVFFAVLVLAGLYVWRNSVSFLPPPGTEAEGAPAPAVQGKDSRSGFINLLRRSIPKDQILKVCVEQWTAAFAHGRKPSRERLERMQAVIDAENARPPRQRDPVATYRKFCEILAKRSAPRGPGSEPGDHANPG